MKKYGLKSLIAAAFVSGALAVLAQTLPPLPEMLQHMVQQMQQAKARNEEQLHTYQWIETTTLTIDGTSRPAMQSTCRYAADGTVLKTPLRPSEQQKMPGPMGGGPLMRHIVEKKKAEIQDQVEEIRGVMQLYLPFNQAKLKEVLLTGNIGLEHDGANGNALVLNDYAKPGDQLKLTLKPVTMQIDRISVKTYFESPADPMTADVSMATLPDGTKYPALTSINAPTKRLSITTAESDFSKAAY